MLGKPTIQIVGGGILGVLIAFLAAARGYAVRVVRMGDGEVPRADSLRNHAWLQSGLLYGSELGRAIRRQMRLSGVGLLEMFGLPVPVERGIFGLKDETEAAQLLANAEELNIASCVDRIPDGEAKRQAGEFYVSGRPYFWVPDAPFEEGGIMAAARDQAKANGAEFANVDRPVKLRRDESSPCGVAVDIGGCWPGSQIVILAAGSRTRSLLNQIGVDRNLVVSQSPLLVTPTCAPLRVPLYVDRKTGLSVVRHAPSSSHPNGCLVIGNTHRREIPSSAVEQRRELNDKDLQSLGDLLPPRIRKAILTAKGTRYTAGHKTEICRPGMGCTVEPWIEAIEEYPGLFAAIPGKATMALYTAENVLDRVDEFFRRTAPAVIANPPIPFPTNTPWDGRIPLHHEKEYDEQLNDACAVTRAAV
ncbi:MAG: FAD-dependent oxidoreductase [Chthoniobacter sp.]|nr:FAD-dependent oxidoreductase [Chthoniobacter sp.]